MNPHDPCPDDPQALPAAAESVSTDVTDDGSSRREFLMKSARRVAYVAPVVLLFHPKRACASNGSTLTYWDGEQIQRR